MKPNRSDERWLAVVTIVTLLSLTGNPARAQVPAPLAQQPLNPLQIALLKWYPANQVTNFRIGDAADAIVFDGAHIWVTAFFADTVTKLDPSTGATLGIFDAGSEPVGITFDGSHIWISDSGGTGNLLKLDAGTGTTLNTFPGIAGGALAFDGTHIWTVSGNDSISEVNPSTGAVVGTFRAGQNPMAIAFDGTHIWAADFHIVDQ